jgi:hypothetical protein
MSTVWSVILNRLDDLSQVWKEWRGSVVTTSSGAADAGAIPMLGPDGQLDSSIVPVVGIELSTDGTPNPVQSALNLIGGTNITVAADHSGGVTIEASGEVASAFSNITTGTNTTATMTVGDGASLQATGTGNIDATEINGIPITGTLTHAGQIPISQPGNDSAVWADPLVQGVSPVGTVVSGLNPVLVGAQNPSGDLANLTVDASGNLNCNVVVGGGSSSVTIINPVDGSDNVKVVVENFPESQAITGTVGVSNFPTTQPISGSVSVSNSPTQPNIFHTGQASGSGNTPIWTPTIGKKFQLLKYMIEGTLNLSQANQGVLTISFQDGTSPISLAHDVYVPSTAMKYNTHYTTGWIDLGGTGFLSSTANNVLNVNLSASLTAGNFRINVAGVEN